MKKLLYDGLIGTIPVKISGTEDKSVEVSTKVQQDFLSTFDTLQSNTSLIAPFLWEKGRDIEIRSQNRDELIKQLVEIGFKKSQAEDIATKAFS